MIFFGIVGVSLSEPYTYDEYALAVCISASEPGIWCGRLPRKEDAHQTKLTN